MAALEAELEVDLAVRRHFRVSSTHVWVPVQMAQGREGGKWGSWFPLLQQEAARARTRNISLRTNHNNNNNITNTNNSCIRTTSPSSPYGQVRKIRAGLTMMLLRHYGGIRRTRKPRRRRRIRDEVRGRGR